MKSLDIDGDTAQKILFAIRAASEPYSRDYFDDSHEVYHEMYCIEDVYQSKE